jgi:hypothetical protein
MGGSFLTLAALCFGFGWAVAGWLVTGLVVALAAVNLFAGVCIGCAIYYWLTRLHVRGFSKSPPPGAWPGGRPAG